MSKATWEDVVLAESDRCITIEGNQYFPPDSVHREYLSESESRTSCPWKGKASYFNVVVKGKTNANAAWYYPSPSAAAANIKGYIAFWKGVKVEK